MFRACGLCLPYAMCKRVTHHNPLAERLAMKYNTFALDQIARYTPSMLASLADAGCDNDAAATFYVSVCGAVLGPRLPDRLPTP